MKVVDKTINLTSEGENRLTVLVGNGQKFHASFMKPSGEYVVGPVQNNPLGSNLQGKTIILSVMVTDTNPSTNKTILIVQINGVEKGNFPSEAEQDNGQVLYSVQLKF